MAHPAQKSGGKTCVDPAGDIAQRPCACLAEPEISLQHHKNRKRSRRFRNVGGTGRIGALSSPAEVFFIENFTLCQVPCQMLGKQY